MCQTHPTSHLLVIRNISHVAGIGDLMLVSKAVSVLMGFMISRGDNNSDNSQLIHEFKELRKKSSS